MGRERGYSLLLVTGLAPVALAGATAVGTFVADELRWEGTKQEKK